VRSYCPL